MVYVREFYCSTDWPHSSSTTFISHLAAAGMTSCVPEGHYDDWRNNLYWVEGANGGWYPNLLPQLDTFAWGCMCLEKEHFLPIPTKQWLPLVDLSLSWIDAGYFASWRRMGNLFPGTRFISASGLCRKDGQRKPSRDSKVPSVDNNQNVSIPE